MTKTVVHVLRHGEVHNPTRSSTAGCPASACPSWAMQMAKAAAAGAGRPGRHATWWPARWSAPSRPPSRSPPQFGLPVAVDERLIESANWFEGKRVSRRRRRAARPAQLVGAARPVHPVVGRAVQGDRRADVRRAAAARVAAEGHEAVCVSHQLPIWTLRRYVERKRLWHDPRKRQCGLASLTSFHFDGAKLVGIGYTEPAAHLVALSPTARTAKGA